MLRFEFILVVTVLRMRFEVHFRVESLSGILDQG